MTATYFSIEGKPQAWQRAGVNGKTFFTKTETRVWQKTVAIEARKVFGRSPAIEGPIELEVHFFCEIPKSWSAPKKQQAKDGKIFPTARPDLSNLLKSIEDACIGVIYKDDSQIVNLSAIKSYGEKFVTVVRISQVSS